MTDESIFQTAPEIGNQASQSLNQKRRICRVVAVHADRYVVEYEMPSGVVYLRQGTAGKTERPVSWKALPKWAVDQVRENTSFFFGPEGNALYTDERAEKEYRRMLRGNSVLLLSEYHQPDSWLIGVCAKWEKAVADEAADPCAPRRPGERHRHAWRLADTRTHYSCERCGDCEPVETD